MITALVVDDEPRAAAALTELLETFPGVDVIGTASDVGDAERFLAGRSPDVVFLDIDMPGRLGFDLVASVPATTRIVFVTAHATRAVDAFRAGAVDYVLKPADRDRLAITIERLEAWAPAARPAAAEDVQAAAAGDGEHGSQAPAGMVTLAFAGGRGSETVALTDIVWVEGVRNYTRVQLRARQPGMVRRTMQEWEAILPASAFGRISRSLIIQLAAIRATQWQSRLQTLVFFEGVADAMPLGRAGTTRLKELVKP
ncbi:MAG: DNA-binding response regulator [Planctomycetia bacterium]|nr:DNA-binding response regulator [Planctomycetia bacterium]